MNPIFELKFRVDVSIFSRCCMLVCMSVCKTGVYMFANYANVSYYLVLKNVIYNYKILNFDNLSTDG